MQYAGTDPWQPVPGAAAASRAPLLQQPPGFAAAAPVQLPQHFSLDGKSGGRGYEREFRIDSRSWGNHRALDLAAAPEAFLVWRDRALGYLCRESPDVRKLLVWAEAQTKEGLAAGMEDAAAEFGIADVGKIDYVLFEGIKLVVSDILLTRARACEGHGVELWRRLHSEWKGSAPQLKHANARRFQDPARCTSVAGLWEALPAWERLGEEVEAAGMSMPEWMCSSALEKLLPAGMLDTLVGRPEVATYADKLRWVKSQMEHTRGVVQAKAAAAAHHGGRKDMDVSWPAPTAPLRPSGPWPTR